MSIPTTMTMTMRFDSGFRAVSHFVTFAENVEYTWAMWMQRHLDD